MPPYRHYYSSQRILTVIVGTVAVISLALLQDPFVRVANAQEDLSNWHCGFDTLTKSLSLMFVGTCPREPLNWCCFQHDRCYEFFQPFIWLLRQCDDQFGNCVRYGYRFNQFCANWLYSTHVDTVKIFGEAYKQRLAG